MHFLSKQPICKGMLQQRFNLYFSQCFLFLWSIKFQLVFRVEKSYSRPLIHTVWSMFLLAAIWVFPIGCLPQPDPIGLPRPQILLAAKFRDHKHGRMRKNIFQFGLVNGTFFPPCLDWLLCCLNRLILLIVKQTDPISCRIRQFQSVAETHLCREGFLWLPCNN